MKKALWLLAICAVLVFALTGTAFANTNSTYAAWSANGAPPTPHAGYALSTVKCAVCHAVHKAPTTDAVNGGSTQMLLAASVANACVYCHIQTTTGNLQLYGGNATWYTTDTQHNHGQTAGCTACHAVHGANTIQATDPGIAQRILKQDPNPATGIQANVPASWAYATGTHDAVISRFCTGCHPYYVGGYADGTAASQHPDSFSTANAYVGHIMTATVSTDYNKSNTASTVSNNTTVAATPDPYCRSCHDAGQVGLAGTGGITNNDFPHYTLGVRFEEAAVEYGSAKSDATNSVQDGVCLKCHADAVGGVNKKF